MQPILVVMGLTVLVVGVFVLTGAGPFRRVSDSDKAKDLYKIHYALWLAYDQQRTMPENLDQLILKEGLYSSLGDYQFTRHGERSDNYTICANFNERSSRPSESPYPDFGTHGEGRECFTPRLFGMPTYGERLGKQRHGEDPWPVYPSWLR